MHCHFCSFVHFLTLKLVQNLTFPKKYRWKIAKNRAIFLSRYVTHFHLSTTISCGFYSYFFFSSTRDIETTTSTWLVKWNFNIYRLVHPLWTLKTLDFQAVQWKRLFTSFQLCLTSVANGWNCHPWTKFHCTYWIIQHCMLYYRKGTTAHKGLTKL